MRLAWAVGAAGSATLVGIGLARFSYTPLIPAIIDAGWFEPNRVLQFGATNFVGYLVGALIAAPLALRTPSHWGLRLAMLLASATFFACAMPVSSPWYFGWRFLAGVAGGLCMALAAPSVLPLVPPERRGIASGVAFSGMGLGIVASGTLVPLLLDGGLAATWMILGGIALALTAFAWGGWPRAAAIPIARHAGSSWGGVSGRVWALQAAYTLCAFGLVPHLVFSVDFVARGLGRGLEAGAVQWILFGIGAVAGPAVAGLIADRIGYRTTLRAGFVLQAVAVALPIVNDGALALSFSSLAAGSFAAGVVGLMLGRLRELTPADEAIRRGAWSVATMAFAIGQSVGGYSLAWFYDLTHDYMLLFGIGVAATLLGLAIELASGRSDIRG